MIDVRSLLGAGGYGTNRISDIIGHSIHHSVSGGSFFTANNLTPEDEVNHLLMIHQYHISKGYGAFAYHTATFPSGRTYWCGNWDSRRAGVANRNHQLVHSVAIGDFSNRNPTDIILRGLAEGVSEFRKIKSVKIDGHRAWATAGWSTSCPTRIQGYIQTIERYAVGQQQEQDDMFTDKDRETLGNLYQHVKNITPHITATDLETSDIINRIILLQQEIDQLQESLEGATPEGNPITYRVQPVIIYPSGQQLTAAQVTKISDGFIRAQQWYKAQLGKTFTLGSIEKWQHPDSAAGLYARYGSGDSLFVALAKEYFRGTYRPGDMIYFVGIGMVSGGGMIGQDSLGIGAPALPGMAMISGGEADVLSGLSIDLVKSYYPSLGWTNRDQSIGALCHEIGHALALLPHSSGNIMGAEYHNFPNVNMLEEDKVKMLATNFFS